MKGKPPRPISAGTASFAAPWRKTSSHRLARRLRRRVAMENGDEESQALVLAFDCWEAAADALQLLRIDAARGIDIHESRLNAARIVMEACWIEWQRIASRVQPIKA